MKFKTAGYQQRIQARRLHRTGCFTSPSATEDICINNPLFDNDEQKRLITGTVNMHACTIAHMPNGLLKIRKIKFEYKFALPGLWIEFLKIELRTVF